MTDIDNRLLEIRTLVRPVLKLGRAGVLVKLEYLVNEGFIDAFELLGPADEWEDVRITLPVALGGVRAKMHFKEDE